MDTNNKQQQQRIETSYEERYQGRTTKKMLLSPSSSSSTTFDLFFIVSHLASFTLRKRSLSLFLSLSLWLYLGHIRLIIFSFIQTNKQAMKTTKQNKRNKHHINDDNILVVCVFWSVIYTGFLLSEFIFRKTKQKIPQTDSNGMGQDSWVFFFLVFSLLLLSTLININVCFVLFFNISFPIYI